MVQLVQLHTAEDLKQFMNLAWKCPDDVGVHTVDDQIADAKSVLGLMSLDYTQPVKVVTENKTFLREAAKRFGV